MKKVFRILRNTMIIGITCILFLSIGFYTWLHVRSAKTFEDYTAFAEKIKSSEDLPLRVQEAFIKVNGARSISTNTLLLNLPYRLISTKGNTTYCPCVEVNYMFTSSSFDRWTVGLDLDRDATSKKCLDYYLANFDFLYNQVGIKKASIFYFKCELNELTDFQLLELMTMTHNPDFYNKADHAKRLRKRVNNIINEEH